MVALTSALIGTDVEPSITIVNRHSLPTYDAPATDRLAQPLSPTSIALAMATTRMRRGLRPATRHSLQTDDAPDQLWPRHRS
jgi:hypothetical protein